MTLRLLACFVLLVAGCGRYTEREREIGHRGEARLNPFLAAERFLGGLGHPVASGRSWPSPDRADSMLMVPAGMLSAEGFVREAKAWTAAGGHLVCLFAHTGSDTNDWSTAEFPADKVSGALAGWVKQAGWQVAGEERWSAALGKRVVGFGDRVFEVSRLGPGKFVPGRDDVEGTKARGLATVAWGKGRLTLVADARPFRNRFLAEAENAALLAHLAEISRDGVVHFVRGSGVSFWSMLWSNGWPALLGLAAVVVVWLRRSLPRFGPMEQEPAVDTRRDHRRHLEATGGYFWRLDRGQGLLGPLRGEVIERLQRRRAAAGAAGDDLFALAESLSGLPRERVQQALSDSRAGDPAAFTRVTADLQHLLKTL